MQYLEAKNGNITWQKRPNRCIQTKMVKRFIYGPEQGKHAICGDRNISDDGDQNDHK